MTLTGRFVALLALGALPIVLLGSTPGTAAAALGLWVLALLGLGILDLSLAGSPRKMILSRSLPSRVRLGESVTSDLYLTNTGTRRLSTVVRDAWQPSAGAGNNRTPLVLPSGERRLVSLPLTPGRRRRRRDRDRDEEGQS